MKPRLIALGVAIAAASSIHLAAAQTPGSAAPPAQGPPAAGYVHGRDLLSAEERQNFHDRMQKAQTREERMQIRDSMRALAEERAKEKGVALPPGHGVGGRSAYRAGEWGRLDDQLFSQDERDAFRAKMQGAQSAEERAEIWREHRAIAEQRAKEKSITLPADPDGHHGPGYGRGPGGRHGEYGQLFSAEERDAFRAKMRGAQTTEERAVLRREQRTLAEQRAKERGVALPSERGPGYGSGASPGPMQRGSAPAGLAPSTRAD
jgi:hypothetical protein